MDLDKVSLFKYLGIVINNRLTWQDHVDQMFSKINKKLGLLKRIRYCLPLDARLLFFNSYVLPLFDYSDIVWGDRYGGPQRQYRNIYYITTFYILVHKRIHWLCEYIYQYNKIYTSTTICIPVQKC